MMNRLVLITFYLSLLKNIADASNALTGRYCKRQETFTEYYLTYHHRYVQEHYTECCFDLLIACANWCDHYRHKDDYYYLQQSRVATRDIYFCCEGYVDNGSGECVPDSSWALWGGWTSCVNQGIVGFRKKRRIRQCTTTCDVGETFDDSYSCAGDMFTYRYTGATTGRGSQCATPPCESPVNLDSVFELDSPDYLYENGRFYNFTMFVSSKKASNGIPGLNLVDQFIQGRANDEASLRANIEGLDHILFTIKESTFGDGIVDYMESNTYATRFKAAQETSNMIRHEIHSNLVANPQPETQTYQSVGYRYKLKDDDYTDTEDTMVIMQVKEDVDTSSEDAIFDGGVDAVYLNRFGLKYPGRNAYFQPRVTAIFGNRRIFNVVATTRLSNSNVYFDGNFDLAVLNTNPDFYRFIKHDASRLNEGYFKFYMPYVDPTVGSLAYSVNWRQRNTKNTEDLRHNTYLQPYAVSVWHDYQVCVKAGCENSNDQSVMVPKRGVELHYSRRGARTPVGKFRIKQRESGLCWAKDAIENKIVLSSRCRDTFLITDSSTLMHVESSKYMDRTMTLVDASEDIFHFFNSSGIHWSQTSTATFCYEENPVENKVNKGTTVRGPSPPDCAENPTCHLALLPDFSTFYTKLNGKSISVVTHDSIKLQVVCQLVADLSEKGNCHYTVNNGVEYKAISPVVTQLRFFYPSDGFFYGYCHKAENFCSWNHQNERVKYLDETEYLSKQNDVNSIAASGLDDMALGGTPEVTDDASVALTSSGIFQATSGGGWEQTFFFST
ncbi:uncharacterized protein [Clytia hemisphaerica]|uniref:uncharacterized protein n=1 Tax=Clytia hemisphaerica TaxID=252671 RepID=UPI0034D5ED7E